MKDHSHHHSSRGDINRKKWRMNALFFAVFLVAATLSGELFFLQIVRGEEFRDKAAGQYRSLAEVFDRGTIYFTEKNGAAVPAAALSEGYLAAIHPEKMDDPEKTFSALSGVFADPLDGADAFDLDKESFLEKAARKDDPYEEIARRISPEKKDRISRLELPGVGFFRERWRNYPIGSLGSHAIGFTGYDESGRIISGRYGIERYYDDILNKNSGRAKQNIFAEIFSGLEEAVSSGGNFHGDVALSLEPQVQGFLEKSLATVQKKWQSKLTGGIVLDPKTGAVYALAAVPDFDPNDISKEKDMSVFNNPLVEGVFEMGSVVKPLVMAAAIDAGKINSQTAYDDETGSVVVDGARIFNFDGRGRGKNIPMQEVLNQSLNTGMVFVMQKMGRDLFREYMKGYGLGEETGIDLPNEAHGLVGNLDSPRTVEYATASFGQGIAVTPIALTRALASLGNGGILPEPHLLKEIRYGAGLTKGFVGNGEPKRVLKPETTEEITRMLVQVVDTALLGGAAKIPHYSVAAKTGTAQIARENGKGYYDDRYLHSFFGYFPAYDPRFIVFLFTVEPVGEKYASHTLTEPFMDLAKFLLAYYEIPPDR